jgi:hypothetical protein
MTNLWLQLNEYLINYLYFDCDNIISFLRGQVVTSRIPHRSSILPGFHRKAHDLLRSKIFLSLIHYEPFNISIMIRFTLSICHDIHN